MARRIAHYGGGGKPRPDEIRCVTVSFTCESCGRHVASDATACPACSATLTATIDEDDFDRECEALLGRLSKTRRRGQGKCDMEPAVLSLGHYGDVPMVTSSCCGFSFSDETGKNGYCPSCGMENVVGSNRVDRDQGYDIVGHMWDDDEDGSCYICERCKGSIVTYGAIPFYCPRCGVGFDLYRGRTAKAFNPDGSLDTEHTIGELSKMEGDSNGV